MKPFAASAPGKVLLCGEYAVLAGAPAICMAVDSRAVVTVLPTDADAHSVVSSSNGQAARFFRSSAQGEVDWQDRASSRPAPHLFECVWRQFRVSNFPALSLTLDTSTFFDGVSNQKLGLGSSAALTVALATALARLSDENGAEVERSFLAHGDFQGGSGSGVDIATSLAGGIIEYRMQRPASRRQLRWPAGLEMQLYWSGSSSSTTEKLALLEAKRKTSSDDRGTGELANASARVAGLWPAAPVAEILSSIASYVSVLKSFSLDHGLGIFDAGHDELCNHSMGSNIVYKPCGAGGGDVGIAFAPSRAELDSFSNFARQAGFRALDLALDERGASCDG